MKKENILPGILFLVSLWMIFGLENFGFTPFAGSESVGHNVIPAISYLGGLIFIYNIVQSLRKKKDVEAKPIPQHWRMLGSILATAAIICVGSAYARHQGSQTLTNEFNSALNGQVTDNEYSTILNEVFAYYKKRAIEINKHQTALDSAGFMETKSLASKEAISGIIALIPATIKEIQDHEAQLEITKKTVLKIINDSSLTDAKKQATIEGFQESTNDVNGVELSRVRNQALIDVYTQVLKLYTFMLANFNEYTVGPDTTGELVVMFNKTSTKGGEYDKIYDRMQVLLGVYEKADQESIAYRNKRLKNNGLNLDVEKVRDQLNN